MNLKKAMIIILSLMCSCSGEMTRKVVLTIPEHPWERYSETELWYYLKWGTSLDDLQTRYISDEREITVYVPLGKTIYFCAYPLGEMQCYGGAVTPKYFSERLVLSQNKGVIADLFLNTTGQAASFADFEKICSWADEICTDYRMLDRSLLIKDMLNGELKKKSVTITKPFEISGFFVPNGIWISEEESRGRVTVTGGIFPASEFYPGVHRFLNAEMNQELRVTVDESGNEFHHIRTAMIPLSGVVYEN